MEILTIPQPDDWHLHIRNGALLPLVLPHTARQFARAIVMPNLKPPVTRVEQAKAYRAEILSHLRANETFEPLMTLYLTAATTPTDVQTAADSGFIHAYKLYPAGATTHSEAGVADLQQIYPVLEAMQKHDLPLLIHGEVVDSSVDIFDRERVFIETQLAPIVRDFPDLRIVLEHLTTRDAVEFVSTSSPKIGATITPQHLLYNRNALLVGGVKPHYYCLPILKRETHRLALVKAATSGSPKFFLGTDSAPHLQTLKENACGCAGCFTAPLAMELYAEVFEAENALDKLAGFASHFGADFYRLPRNQSTITLKKQEWTVPATYGDAEQSIVPLRAGETLRWQLVSSPQST